MGFSRSLLVIVGILLSLAAAGCTAERGDRTASTTPSTDLTDAAHQVVSAFRTEDGERLARLVHPKKGVRFSPYAYVEVVEDQVFSSTQMARFWRDPQTYRWGVADGTGDPIELTPAQYAERFVMDRDFGHPTSIAIDRDRAYGNTVNNAAEVYPQARRVEFYVAPGPGQGQPAFDWAALRLVFEQLDGAWYLVGVIHDQWTT
jgi:hypothetical protein